jgi:hypothetical protein
MNHRLHAAAPRSAGVCLLVYGLGTAAAFMASGAPGGDYSDSKVATYISSGHFATAGVLWYVAALASLALLGVGAGIRHLPGAGRLAAALAGAGAAVGVAGAFVAGGLVVAMAEGGTAVRGAVPHPVVYTISEIGNLLAVCAPALCVGVAAIAVAVRAGGPVPLRALAIVVGLCGVLAPFFFTYFVYVLGTLVAGLVVALRRPQVAPQARPAPSLV